MNELEVLSTVDDKSRNTVPTPTVPQTACKRRNNNMLGKNEKEKVRANTG